MLEGLAAWIINTYVGEYLENLSTDQLSIGLLQGEISLDNIPIKKNALDFLGLPIVVKTGFVNKMQLRLSLRRLKSEPWVILMDGLYIVVGPAVPEQKVLHNEKRKKKKALLDALEEEWKSKCREECLPTSQNTSSWLSYSTSLVSSIMENLQLQIRNVHVRYEDSTIIPNTVLAFGLTLKYLSVQSADESWEPKFVEKGSSMRKLMQLEGLALYWDTSSSMWASQDPAALMNLVNTENHQFLLSPVDGQARLNKNMSEKPLRSRSSPRFACDIKLSCITLSLSQSQFFQIRQWQREFHRLELQAKHEHLRPSQGILDNAHGWWQFAIHATLDPISSRNHLSTWKHTLATARSLVHYYHLYLLHLTSPESFTPEMKAEKLSIEMEMELETVITLRQMVQERVKKEDSMQSRQSQEQGVKYSFLSYWFPGWYGSPTSSPIKSLPPTEVPTPNPEVDKLKTKLEEELQDVLENVENDALLRQRDAISCQLHFSLPQGTLSLVDAKKLVTLEFLKVNVGLETRPRSCSFKLSLSDLSLHDYVTHGTQYPIVICKGTKGKLLRSPYETSSSQQQQHLFEMVYENHPSQSRFDHRLLVKASALDVVYNAEVLRLVVDFFSVHSSALSHHTQAELRQRIDQIFDTSADRKMGLHSKWELQLAIAAPQIILSENICSKSAKVLVIDLGSLHFSNTPDASFDNIKCLQESRSQEEDEEEFKTPCSSPDELLGQAVAEENIISEGNLRNSMYEKYVLKLADLQIFALHSSYQSRLYILDSFSISLQMERRLFDTTDPQWPNITFSGNLPRLVFHASEERVQALKTCLEVIKMPAASSSKASSPVSPLTSLSSFSFSDAQNREASLLLLMQFCIEHVSLIVESRGRCVAELQVSGVRMTLSHHPYDTTVALCVQGLLLVDALQTYGPDYELLAASHQGVCMDSASGSLLDNEGPLKELCSSPGSTPTPLITLELNFITPSSPEETPMNIVTGQFNSLDIIANQSTIVELVDFVRRVSSTPEEEEEEEVPECQAPSSPPLDPQHQPADRPPSFPEPKLEVNFDFQRLSLLLLRATDSCQKLCTATMTGVRLQASVGEELAVTGVLGSLQILDVSPSVGRYSQIVSVGQECADERALVFKVNRTADGCQLGLEARMASVAYAHCPHFLAQLASCASQFKQWSSSLTSAATEMAIGFVAPAPCPTTHLSVDVVLQSPVVTIPSGVNSSHALLLHLGRISAMKVEDRLELEVRDMKARSVDLDSTSQGLDLLHNSTLQIDLSWQPQAPPFHISIKGQMITPVNLALTQRQYEHILATISYVSYPTQEGGCQAVAAMVKSQSPLSATTFHFHLEVPKLALELRGELGQGIVALYCQNFILQLSRHTADQQLQVTLQSLMMEDLLEPSGSPHRFLMLSDSGPSPGPLSKFLSSSCPNLNAFSTAGLFHSPSLPHSLDTPNFFRLSRTARYPAALAASATTALHCPKTPPPSPSSGDPRTQPTLVRLQVTIQDPSCHHPTGYSKVHLDFNSLEMAINIHTWLMVLDFFDTHPIVASAASDQPASSSFSTSPALTTDLDGTSSQLQWEMEVRVRSLTLVLNKVEYQLARANVSDLSCHLEASKMALTAVGHLGSMSLVDLTPHGRLYPERFVTSGKEALHFHIIKYNKADPDLAREFDLSIQCKMSSVRFLYTQRFHQEFLSFFSYFSQIQILLAHLRSAAAVPKSEPSRSQRVKLDLCVESPLIVVPVAGNSEKVLVIELASLSVYNSFLPSGTSGTISSIYKAPSLDLNGVELEVPPDIMTKGIYGSLPLSNFPTKPPPQRNLGRGMTGQCLLDVMHVDLTDVNLYSAIRQQGDHKGPISFTSYFLLRQGPDLLQEKFMLQFQVERNLDYLFNNQVPDMSMEGRFSSVHFTLNTEQYQLVSGILTRNIGESTQDLHQPPPQAAPLQDGRNTAVVQQEVSSSHIKFGLHLDMKNVTLELVGSQASLARLDFIKSRLSFECHSNSIQDIDLVSHEIRVSDTRFQDAPVNNRPNVFPHILQPTRKGRQVSLLQAELHCRLGPDGNLSRLTLLLNNMRLMAVFCWFKEVWDFLAASKAQDESSGLVAPPPNSLTPPPAAASSGINFEVKINATDTEFILVEDTSTWDTNAVIIRGTTVVSWKPREDKVLSCSLQHLEVFSCVMGVEEDTALSILDPVTVSAELCHRQLEVALSSLHVRLSYNDVTMLLQISTSIRHQLGLSSFESRPGTDWQLTSLSIPWQDSAPSSSSAMPVDVVEVRLASGAFTIIDDCRDADVPLLELTLADLLVRQAFPLHLPSYAHFNLIGEYYNRALSGWEPFLEPWRCEVRWTIKPVPDAVPRLEVGIDAKETLNFNVTSTMLDLWKVVKNTWMEDLSDGSSTTNLNQGYGYKRRQPFVPFALKNDTGCKLYFTTLISSSESLKKASGNQPTPTKIDSAYNWIEVEPDQIIPFSFEEPKKLRHHDTHEPKIHQILLRVKGWKQVGPVSVDRVGTFFREAKSQVIRVPMIPEVANARVVFDVNLEGNARKLIVVRSALRITNSTTDTLEVKMENLGLKSSSTSKLLYLVPGDCLPVPLPFVHSQMWVKPTDRPYGFSTNSLVWNTAHYPGDMVTNQYNCLAKNGKTYRLHLLVKREGYPADEPRRTAYVTSQPGHHLSLFAPLELTNLLPCDLHFQVKDCDVGGVIKPGKAIPLHTVDPDSPVYIRFRLEGFPQCREITIHPGSKEFLNYLELWDSKERLLFLQVRLILLHEHSVRVHVSAPYWLVNKSGLPLVFRQNCSSPTGHEAAGQSTDHEMARSVAPLLFSFSDTENSKELNIRVGRSLHPLGSPQWCQPFSLDTGIRYCKLRVLTKGSHPEWVYFIGVEIRKGRGRYRDTYIVTFAPRFQLNNQTSFKLEIAQKCDIIIPQSKCMLNAMPKSTIPFHWPRSNQENLLCIRLPSVKDCCWSGGFSIHMVSAFHINMRDTKGKCHFLRVKVVSQGPSLVVIFKETDNMPPPYRIDNYSEVPVLYYQCHVKEERLKTYIRPHHSVPYAWDEPNLQPLISCCAPGGTTGTYNFESFGEGEQLYYENFIYIAFTGTFLSHQNAISTTEDSITGQQLVLDVPYGANVILNKKEPGSRTQLWRLSSKQQLHHEGSGPPRDPRGKSGHQGLVLDVGTFAGEQAPLVLRRPDNRRLDTQTWTFTPDGRLCCKIPNCYVQVKDGYLGLCQGKGAVLGPTATIILMTLDSGVPIEQAVSVQKLRGGSGVLAVRVQPDGPTRVLHITDIRHKKALSQNSDNLGSDWVLVEEKEHLGQCSNLPIHTRSHEMDIQIHLNLTRGLGVSLVNSGREELVYAVLDKIRVEWLCTATNMVLDAAVARIQVDNQLRLAERPVVLFTTSSHRISPPPSNHHGLHLTLDKMIMPCYRNAEIFKHLILTTENLTVQLEELLLLKLLEFFGYNQTDAELEKLNEDESQVHRSSCQNLPEPKHYYFTTFKLAVPQVRLSVLTASNLPPRLALIKHRMAIRLVRFEDVLIELDSFIIVHPFETLQYLNQSIVEHYTEELKSQFAKILGSVDILGNPMGLVNDVSTGISSLINEGSFGGLIKNVAHGLSDSAAKVTGSLSDGIGMVAMDEKHQEMRKRIKQESQGTNQFVVGIKGLGYGLLGGMTSLIGNTYEGASSDGVHGFLSGLGRGLLGTVAKPAVGFLDFASGAAGAVRDTSKRSSHGFPQRRRPPRMCAGEGGFLPPFCPDQARGQDCLYFLNQHNYSELFISYDQLRSGLEDLQSLVSTEKVYILSRGSHVVVTVNFGNLDRCEVMVSSDKVYLQLCYKPLSPEAATKLGKKPQVRCDSEEIANKVCQKINYAKNLYEERHYTVAPTEEIN